jgi:hypothetical protein
LRRVREKIVGLKVNGFVSARLEGREVVVEMNQEAFGEKARLDDVYVLKTDTPASDTDVRTLK